MTIAKDIAKIYPDDAKKHFRASRIEDAGRLIQIAKTCDAVMEQGRGRKDVIFFSKFNPSLLPPDFLHARRTQRTRDADSGWDNADQHPSNTALMLEHRHDLPVHLEDEALLDYRSRSPHGIPELRKNLVQWLANQGIDYIGSDSSPCFVCANSVNSTLLPNLFRLRKTGGLFSEWQNEIAAFTPIYGLLPFNAYDARLDVTMYKTSKEDHYKPTARKIQNLLKHRKSPDKLRAIALVNPANPTGTCFSKEEVDAIADVIAEHNQERARRGVTPVLVIVDETFRNIMWSKKGGQEFYPFAKNKKLRPYTISLNTFSKDLGPGVGFAFAYGPPELIQQISSFDGPAYETQLYATEVFNPKYKRELNKHRSESVKLYKERYSQLVAYLRDELNPKLKEKFGGDHDYVTIVNEPNAGFHVALDFSGLRGAVLHDHGTGIPLETSAHLAVALMEKANVVAYPGEMFYLDGKDMILRASLNLDRDITLAHEPSSDWMEAARMRRRYTVDPILEAMKRIKDFCLNLEPPARWQTQAITVLEPSR